MTEIMIEIFSEVVHLTEGGLKFKKKIDDNVSSSVRPMEKLAVNGELIFELKEMLWTQQLEQDELGYLAHLLNKSIIAEVCQ